MGIGPVWGINSLTPLSSLAKIYSKTMSVPAVAINLFAHVTQSGNISLTIQYFIWQTSKLPEFLLAARTGCLEIQIHQGSCQNEN